eukprot:scaffold76607_cov20-Tisochrysis_lutea.AAC.5
MRVVGVEGKCKLGVDRQDLQGWEARGAAGGDVLCGPETMTAVPKDAADLVRQLQRSEHAAVVLQRQLGVGLGWWGWAGGESGEGGQGKLQPPDGKVEAREESTGAAGSMVPRRGPEDDAEGSCWVVSGRGMPTVGALLVRVMRGCSSGGAGVAVLLC